MTSTSVRDRLREFFLMSRAIAQADQLTASKAEAGVAQARSARSLLAAAEALEDGPEWQLAVVLLLRQAAVLAGRAIVTRRKLEVDGADLAAVWQSAVQQPELHSLVRDTTGEPWVQVAHLVGSGLTEAQCIGPTQQLRALKEASFPLVHRLVRLLEADIELAKRLRTRRLVRWLGAAGALALLTIVLVAIDSEPSQNLARNASVTAIGTYLPDIYDPKGLVNGDKANLGCFTILSDRPWVMFDLAQARTIRRVVVTNRLDGGLSQLALPLLIETSRDGTSFEPFGRQDKDFKTWNAKGKATKARYVRLSVDRPSAVLHLNEVEIY